MKLQGSMAFVIATDRTGATFVFNSILLPLYPTLSAVGREAGLTVGLVPFTPIRSLVTCGLIQFYLTLGTVHNKAGEEGLEPPINDLEGRGIIHYATHPFTITCTL